MIIKKIKGIVAKSKSIIYTENLMSTNKENTFIIN